MVQELMHDPLFLGRSSQPATKDDLPVARDLLDTLQAHRETCVGMAANMIGDPSKQSSRNSNAVLPKEHSAVPTSSVLQEIH